MVACGLNFVALAAIIKHVGADIPAPQAAFLRYLTGLVFILPFLGQWRRARISNREHLLLALRGLVHSIAVLLWFFTVTRIPIAEVTSLGYLTPVFVTLGAALFLGDRLNSVKSLALLGALCGALVILRPGFREIDVGHFAILASTCFFSTSFLLAKRAASRFSAAVIVTSLSIVSTICMAPAAFLVWIPPTPEQVLWLFFAAFFATAGNFTMTQSFRNAPVSVTQPVIYLQLVWATLLGAIAFGEGFDMMVILGGAIVVASVSAVSWHSAFRKQRGRSGSGVSLK